VSGAAGAGPLDAGAPELTDAATDAAAPSPCPAGFECVTDPLLMALSVCLKSGAVPAPVSCTTDADCVKAGLPKGLCAMEEETGLNGCVQLCTP
jgi:hypothetical protein